MEIYVNAQLLCVIILFDLHFYYSAGYRVLEATREERNIESQVQEERSAVAQTESLISEQENILQALEQRAEELKSHITTINAKLEEAKKQVEKLEVESKAQVEQSLSVFTQLDKCRFELKSLAAQAMRHKENVNVSQND